MKRSPKKIKTIYENDLIKYGDNHKGVGWKRKSEAQTRYEIMLDLFSNDNKKKIIIDFGCGLSHFYTFLKKKRFKNFKYIGLDISEKMIEISKKKYPNNQYFCLDIINDHFKVPYVDYTVINGLFTQKGNCNNAQMNNFLKKILFKVFKFTKKGVALNLMSPIVDWKNKGNFYPDTKLVFNIIKNLSKKFVIRHDYGLFEYTIYIYKKN